MVEKYSGKIYAMPVAYSFLDLCMVKTFSRVWINRVSFPVLLADIYLKERGIFFLMSSFAPENVVSRDRFGGPVASACCSFPTLKAECDAYLRITPHTVLLVRRANCPCPAVESRAAVRETGNHAIYFYGFVGFNTPLSVAAFCSTVLVYAAAVLALYCRFFKEKSERISTFRGSPSQREKISKGLGGIMGCKDKSAPMVIILGQQCVCVYEYLLNCT